MPHPLVVHPPYDSLRLRRRPAEGLDTEINEIVEGTNLYTPSVLLEHVVLPSDQKERIMSAVTSYAAFKAFRHRTALERAAREHASTDHGMTDAPSFHSPAIRSSSVDALAGGARGGLPSGGGQGGGCGLGDEMPGLVFLFSGPSGTGKTMTVNAIAHQLSKRVLLVNFNAMVSGSSSSGGGGGGYAGGAMQSLFREAAMHDAIVFFDECESLFAQRGHGGSAQLTELLTEIERHDGMIFLATNRPFDLDEAMHRRITASFEFRPPHWLERQQIWELHATADCAIAAVCPFFSSFSCQNTGTFPARTSICLPLCVLPRNSLLARGCFKRHFYALEGGVQAIHYHTSRGSAAVRFVPIMTSQRPSFRL